MTHPESPAREESRTARLLHRRGHDPDRALSRADAASRITAYVYGTVVALATVIPLSREDAASGLAFTVVLSAALSTFLAHALAESAGRRVRSDDPLTRAELVSELRDSVPVLSSGLVPAAILGLAWLGGVPGLAAQLVAEAYLVVRLALTGLAIELVRGRRPSGRTFAAGLGLAALGAGISVLKVLLGSH